MKHQIGIIGYGFVGRAVEYGFKDDDLFIYDKYKDLLSLDEVCQKSDFIFICVPTPMKADESGIDLAIVEEVCGEIAEKIKGTEKIIIIKSTVIPGTTQKLIEKYPEVNFCFNPEFLTEANYLEDFVKADRCVIGANSDLVSRSVVVLYKDRFPEMPMFQTDPTSAEMVKYMSNTFLAVKVTFANQMYEICEKLGINYEEVKKMVVADHRIYDSHLDITSQRGFGGKCLPKDLVSLIGFAKQIGVDTKFLEETWQKNLEIRKVKDWEEIPFVVSKSESSD